MWMTNLLFTTILDTVRSYIERNKMGRFAPKEDAPTPPTADEIAREISVGSRCEVLGEDGVTRHRGVVRFVGETEFGNQPSVWIGVEYDDAYGKNDGSYAFI